MFISIYLNNSIYNPAIKNLQQAIYFKKTYYESLLFGLLLDDGIPEEDCLINRYLFWLWPTTKTSFNANFNLQQYKYRLVGHRFAFQNYWWQFEIQIPGYKYLRFLKIPPKFARPIIFSLLVDAIVTYSFYRFNLFIKYLFWQIIIPKHRFIFLFIRKFCEYLFYNLSHCHTLLKLGFKLKGKLAVTGNKRTRKFFRHYYKPSTGNLTDVTIKKFFYFVRTDTGIFSVFIYLIF